MTNIQRALIGKVIIDVTLEKSNEFIVFTLEDKSIVKLQASGDCCSYTWIESLDAPKALLGKVQAVEDILMPDLGNIDGEHHKDVNQVNYYGLKITTNKGVCVIDYRNDSNGYYGGSLDLV